jgi:hypothetical protein
VQKPQKKANLQPKKKVQQSSGDVASHKPAGAPSGKAASAVPVTPSSSLSLFSTNYTLKLKK